jgi:hypothetical protein
MFLSGLKEKSIARKIRKDVEKRSFSLSRKRISTIAILQDVETPFDAEQLKVLADLLEVNVANITLLTYISKVAKAQKDDPQFVTDKFVGWNGVLKTKHLKKFAQTKFDLLVSFQDSDLLSLKAVVAGSQSQMKVGITEDSFGIYDLVIHTKTGEEAVFIKELNRYLRILK